MSDKQNYPAIVAGLWIEARSTPPYQEGWYLVVVDGHGKKRMAVDYYDVDDIQWREEYKDDAVSVTYYRKLPKMP